ncbi:hypothetical protein A2382_04045 [Candidatus Woesebacteria bacterium RIFOXYB1_FULL_38_16]|uniref:Uncharacterized protein n=1 Tax=Candidatus Woesebacteria bacterium RIFOXYB1_FULL_38_16 TaxID=1802538 RepID=A0A1F8CQY6_9BACT|nr:MAG: hypothetical protein A2191_00005 [Candidatus Woesebacteria bacterium RIFOXYA1_FULL_38_9]OGM78710.1 MAG: hypothetical protein A2382_04045 [Candidatus Woesebacteria bacterium RIFOXYB1_FULL_38_16]
MPPGNRGEPGYDQDGNPDDSWFGGNSSPNQQGGEHHTIYTEDDGRYSWDTDSDGYYVEDSGHGGGINNDEYQDDDS